MTTTTSADKQTEAADIDARLPWEPLDYEKIDAKEAEAGFVGTGADNTFYS